MASRTAQKRLTKEYRSIDANPPPFIVARPNDENILEWHYVITGPDNTPYEDGQYHGILRFPANYPFQPPAISMVTPNGRFSCNTRLCLSMSDYHPDTWNPAWSVSTILTGLLSFMTSNDPTTGSINTSDSLKRKFASESKNWNNKENSRFTRIFPELVKQNELDLMKKTIEEEKEDIPEQIINLNENLHLLDPEDKARLFGDDEMKFNYSRFTFFGVIVAALFAYLIKSL
ncbi:ubiquitin-conjugating enzyme E2 6 [[Candida] jaroonii]|uniref:Ubiquitin-conjugating enzyme E2 6 n=1 Tax=[Candida] jaroonii TaxID=467808 RepID=A0ACA9YB07_9ASCO|nr:ubiquitin-conjugating enzyme E2 6 [[Candida] jaroonii]